MQFSLTPHPGSNIMTSRRLISISFDKGPMPTQIRHNCSSTFKEEVILSWKSHLARKYPGKLAFSVLAILLASFAAHYAIGGIATIAVALVMIASTSDFLLPVQYEISKDGATCKMLFKSASIRWADVRHYYLDEYGVKLSPLEHQSRLEAFRGVYLRFNNNDEQVIDIIKSLKVKS